MPGLSPEDALARWPLPAGSAPRTCGDEGLINSTWWVDEPPRGVLQWLNPIFRPEVNRDIAAVTARLAEQGLVTPRLVPAATGELWLDDPEAGSWRVLSYVPGTTRHTMASPELAREAGRLVGRFHRAVNGWSHNFHFSRPQAHDTLHHMATLQRAIEGSKGHALQGPAGELGREILDRWATWRGTLDLPTRICHGDLKISNVRFDEAGTVAVCLIDLDTLAQLPLAVELGDAWRSWCNTAGEDDPDSAGFDLPIFEASARGFLEEGPPLLPGELASLGAGCERICLELAARFCADALLNGYFKEDRRRFPRVGAHNLHRARGQLALSKAARAARPQVEAILGDAAGL